MSSSSLSVGIVGLPNAGKSTLFNALLKKQQALAANYPFATIEPNIGVVPVPDPRLSILADAVKISEGLEKTPPLVPATVKFVDIAGLVAGASKGEGLGNQFLSHIREVDLICHVSRAFNDSDVVHVAGDVDPKRDQGIIETELILADLQTLEKQVEPKRTASKEEFKRWELIGKLKVALNESKRAIDVLREKDDQVLVADLQLLTMKPYITVLNVSENEVANFKTESDAVIVSAKIEAELASLSEEEQQAYLQELGLEKSGLERLIQKAYDKLGLISFLTGGEKEARAWTITRGTTAPVAAGVIHTDFEKKFIKAEVVSFSDFVEQGGWSKAREVGKVRLEGRDYVMRDDDVVEFKIGA